MVLLKKLKEVNMSSGVQITDANFQAEVMESSVPVLLDFWADWCPPCKMIAPHLDQLAGEYAGKVKIGKINVDEENNIASKHGVVSIPTLIIYNKGTIVRQSVGALPKSGIENLFKDLV
jgi:thioredoxin 1